MWRTILERPEISISSDKFSLAQAGILLLWLLMYVAISLIPGSPALEKLVANGLDFSLVLTLKTVLLYTVLPLSILLFLWPWFKRIKSGATSIKSASYLLFFTYAIIIFVLYFFKGRFTLYGNFAFLGLALIAYILQKFWQEERLKKAVDFLCHPPFLSMMLLSVLIVPRSLLGYGIEYFDFAKVLF